MNVKKHVTKAGQELPILNLRGKDYLEVKYRLMWFREEHSDWAIETEIIEAYSCDSQTLARAVIRNDQNRIVSTGHKFENERGFPDHREKAETGAIGRALAHLGYGTQFCGGDLDEGKRLVDSPVANPPQSLARKSVVRTAKQIVEDVDPGEYQCTFGKYRGMKIKNIDLNELENYCAYIENDARVKGVEIKGTVLEFISNAEKFRKTLEITEGQSKV